MKNLFIQKQMRSVFLVLLLGSFTFLLSACQKSLEEQRRQHFAIQEKIQNIRESVDKIDTKLVGIEDNQNKLGDSIISNRQHIDLLNDKFESKQNEIKTQLERLNNDLNQRTLSIAKNVSHVAKTAQDLERNLKVEINTKIDKLSSAEQSWHNTHSRNYNSLKNELGSLNRFIKTDINPKISSLERKQLTTEKVSEMIEKQLLSKQYIDVYRTRPSGTIVLGYGDELALSVYYHFGYRKISLALRPYKDGKLVDGFKVSQAERFEQGMSGRGSLEISFYFDEEADIDEVQILMVDAVTGNGVNKVSYKVSARWVAPEDVTELREKLRALENIKPVEVNDPNGQAGWENEYVINLKTIFDYRTRFRVSWMIPGYAMGITDEKPDAVVKAPDFRHENQKFFYVNLGDANDNKIYGAIDYRTPEKPRFSFDLYLDRDNDGDLAEDLIENQHSVRDVCVKYKDGTIEKYGMYFYVVQKDDGSIGLYFSNHTGRYGFLEADKKRIQICVADSTCNGIFDDSNDDVFFDKDLDGRVYGRHKSDEYTDLFSEIELPGGTYKVAEIDPAGRRLVLRRRKNN